MKDENILSGPIPSEIGLLTSLEELDLGTSTWWESFNWTHRVSDNHLISLFANGRLQRVVRPNSTRDWPIEFSNISLDTYVDLMRIFQLNPSRFWRSLCFLLSQLPDYNNLSGQVPPEFGQLDSLLGLDIGMDLTRIFQLDSSRFWQSFCFLFSQLTDNNNLTGDLPSEFGEMSDTLDYCYFCKIHVVPAYSHVPFWNWSTHIISVSQCLCISQLLKIMVLWETLTTWEQCVRWVMLPPHHHHRLHPNFRVSLHLGFRRSQLYQLTCNILNRVWDRAACLADSRHSSLA
jgi:hypothetical protein